MLNKISKKLSLIILAIAVTTLGAFYWQTNKERDKATVRGTTPQALWNTKLVDKYEDEPSIENQFLKESSSTAWLVPADPLVIHEDPVLKFRVDKLFNDQEIRSEAWDYSPYLEEKLNKQNLDKKYYDFFIKEGRLPWAQENADLNGDGIKDKIFKSNAVGCGSCHVNLIDIFVNEKIYVTFSNEGETYPSKDSKGFYITNAFDGEDYATCCPNRFVISKLEWNGDGFTEIVRKTIWVIPKK